MKRLLFLSLFFINLSIFSLNFIPKSFNIDSKIFSYSHFSVLYRENYRQAECSFYTISEELFVEKFKRRDNFTKDINCPTSADPKNYRNSGYDRGHLTPAHAMSFNDTALKETFFTTNISPMFPQFNRQAWRILEEESFNLLKKYGTIFVATGPVWIQDSENYIGIGNENILVPILFYKIVMVKTDDDKYLVQSVIMANRDLKIKTKAEFYERIADFIVSVDVIELLTGIDFFHELSDDLEDELEGKFSMIK